MSCPVVTPNGSVLGRQFKIHLFGLQRKTLKSGSKMEVFDIGRLKFSVAICYDLVFPEIARSAVREGADLLFFPSKIPKEGINPWHLYLQYGLSKIEFLLSLLTCAGIYLVEGVS